MIEVTQQKIEELAPNAEAAKKGRELVKKNKFSNLKINAEKNLIWGECAGSGKNPYYCSADYIDPNNPVFRCNCPSRQFPCKHSVGLLYCFEANAGQFETAQKLLRDMVNTGLSSVDAKMRATLKTQVKDLGNYYIGGIQTAFNNLLLSIEEVKNEEYTAVVDNLNYLSALLKKATDYLKARKEDPEGTPELSSAIEEQIGYVWKLVELMQYGQYEENASLVQLSFNSYDNEARKEYVDEGVWLNLKTGKIYKTLNYRPYKAAKYIKEDNSVFSVLQLKDLYIYPGDTNPRIRWEADGASERPLSQADLATVKGFASGQFAETIKNVKNTIKNPLMDKHPVVLLALHKAYRVGEDLVVEDANGFAIILRDIEEGAVSPTGNLKSFLPANAEGLSLVVMMHNDVASGLLSAQPLSLITAEKVIRLLY